MPFFTQSTYTSKTLQVRATLATMFGMALVVGFFLGIVTPEAFVPIASVAVTWYFTKRDEQEKTKEDKDINKGS